VIISKAFRTQGWEGEEAEIRLCVWDVRVRVMCTDETICHLSESASQKNKHKPPDDQSIELIFLITRANLN